jgi:hypothetical protein
MSGETVLLLISIAICPISKLLFLTSLIEFGLASNS